MEKNHFNEDGAFIQTIDFDFSAIDRDEVADESGHILALRLIFGLIITPGTVQAVAGRIAVLRRVLDPNLTTGQLLHQTPGLSPTFLRAARKELGSLLLRQEKETEPPEIEKPKGGSLEQKSPHSRD